MKDPIAVLHGSSTRHEAGNTSTRAEGQAIRWKRGPRDGSDVSSRSRSRVQSEPLFQHSSQGFDKPDFFRRKVRLPSHPQSWMSANSTSFAGADDELVNMAVDRARALLE